MKRSTIKQIFEVLKIFKQDYNGNTQVRSSYNYAVKKVANHYNVKYQTIGDACRRRLRLTHISEFYELLSEWYNGKPEKLITILKNNTEKSNHSEIDNFFKNIHTNQIISNNIQKDQYETYSFRLSKKDSKLLKILAEVNDLLIPNYLTKLVTESIRLKMKEFTDGLMVEK